MFNKCIYMGRICNDLELKKTPSGVSVCSFRVAVDRSYSGKGEEKKTDFFNIVTWRTTAEFVCKYFSKGRMILVEGENQTREYTDKNGNKQTVVELVASSVSFTGEAKEGGNSGSTVATHCPLLAEIYITEMVIGLQLAVTILLGTQLIFLEAGKHLPKLGLVV